MEAFYDLARCPPTHDFLNWLYRAEQLRIFRGDEHLQVRFVKGYRKQSPRDLYYGHDRRDWRIQNLLMPLAWLLPSVDDVSMGNVPGKDISYLNPGKPVSPILKAPKQAVEYVKGWKLQEPYVTISLRQSDFEDCRNTLDREWEPASKVLEAMGYSIFVIQDGELALRKPIMADAASQNPAIKLALWEGAAMNLMINSGPMVMALYADVPMLAWKCEVPGIQCGTRDHMSKSGFGPDHDWSTPRNIRRMFWEPDTFENIVPVLEKYMPQIKEAA